MFINEKRSGDVPKIEEGQCNITSFSMGGRTYCLKVKDDLIDVINDFVKMGVALSRSEFVREAIWNHIIKKLQEIYLIEDFRSRDPEDEVKLDSKLYRIIKRLE